MPYRPYFSSSTGFLKFFFFFFFSSSTSVYFLSNLSAANWVIKIDPLITVQRVSVHPNSKYIIDTLSNSYIDLCIICPSTVVINNRFEDIGYFNLELLLSSTCRGSEYSVSFLMLISQGFCQLLLYGVGHDSTFSIRSLSLVSGSYFPELSHFIHFLALGTF